METGKVLGYGAFPTPPDIEGVVVREVPIDQVEALNLPGDTVMAEDGQITTTPYAEPDSEVTARAEREEARKWLQGKAAENETLRNILKLL